MASFKGRVILITGGTSGIGLGTAHFLASREATLSLIGTNPERLEKTERDFREKYPGIQILTCIADVRNEEQIKAWVEKSVQTFSEIHGAVNMAGVIGKSIGLKGIAEQDVDEWNYIFDVNVHGLMLCLKHQLQHMSPGGSIVNAASISGLIGRRNNAAYSTSKHAVIGLTRSAAKESGARNIRVNAVCPGYIDTPMHAASKAIAASVSLPPTDSATSSSAQGAPDTAGIINAERRQREVEAVALGRTGKVQEVAELVGFLLGEGAGFMTGNAVSVDGGWNC